MACCRLISLFTLIFFIYFCLGTSVEDAVHAKYLLCMICVFLRNTGSIICVVDRHQILFDVASSDHFVHLTSMVMEFNCSIDIPFLCITFHRQLHKDADDIVYCIFLHISVIFNLNFHSLYILSFTH